MHPEGSHAYLEQQSGNHKPHMAASNILTYKEKLKSLPPAICHYTVCVFRLSRYLGNLQLPIGRLAATKWERYFKRLRLTNFQCQFNVNSNAKKVYYGILEKIFLRLYEIYDHPPTSLCGPLPNPNTYISPPFIRDYLHRTFCYGDRILRN